MKKLFTLILILTVVLSCKKSTTTTLDLPQLNKSIFIPLTIEELNICLKSDSIFEIFYEGINEFNSELSDIEKAKYYDITYVRLLKFVNQYELMSKNRFIMVTDSIESVMKKDDSLCYEYLYNQIPRAAEVAPLMDSIVISNR